MPNTVQSREIACSAFSASTSRYLIAADRSPARRKSLPSSRSPAPPENAILAPQPAQLLTLLAGQALPLAGVDRRLTELGRIRRSRPWHLDSFPGLATPSVEVSTKPGQVHTLQLQRRFHPLLL